MTSSTLSGAASSPEMMSMLQDRLDRLQGAPSGYIDSLPQNVQARLKALKNLQDKHNELENNFEEEVFKLEKKFLSLYQPLYNQRSTIVTGAYEPTPAESEREDDEEELEGVEKVIVPANPNINGIPEFWLTVFKNSPNFQELISEKDEEALAHLIDLRYVYLPDNLGFKIEFEFNENEFFKNKVLTKSYFLKRPDLKTPVMFDRAEASTIEWNDGKNLGFALEIKKQRNKNTNKSRTVKRSVPVPTFFNFFVPPTYPSEEDQPEEEEDMDTLEQMIEADYENGEVIKSKLIPNAIDWFTGDALDYDEDFEGFGDEEGFDSDGDDDEDETSALTNQNADGTAANPECKQQ